MAIYPVVLDLIKQQEAINATVANTELTKTRVEQLKSKLSADDALRKAVSSFDQLSVAAGTAPPKDDEGFEGNPQVQAINRTIQAAQSDAQLQRNLATVMRRAGQWKEAQQADDNARLSDQNAQNGVLRLQEERKNLMRRIGATAGSVTQDTLPSVVKQLDSLAPGWDQRVNVDRTPEGKVTWGPRTEAEMDRLAKRSMTAFQQSDLGIKSARAELAADDLEFKKEKEAQDIKENDRKDRREREKIGLTEREIKRKEKEDKARQARFDSGSEFRSATVENLAVEREQRRGERIQSALDKEFVIEQLPKYEVANAAALDVMKTFTENGQRQVSQPQALALADALRSTNVQFKARSGDKFSSKQLNDAMGVLQKTEKFWTSVGQGNLRPDKNTLQDMAHQVNQAYAVVVEEAAKATLRAKDRAASRGVDPETIQGRGDLGALERAGKLKKVVNEDGDTFYLFGPAITDPKKATPNETLFKVSKKRPRRIFKVPSGGAASGTADDEEE